MASEKKKRGRPSKFNPVFIERAYEYCLIGATDEELATYFCVHVDTIYEWNNKYPEFSEAKKRGKIEADRKIAHSLFQRASGMTILKQQAIKLTTKTPVLDKDGKPTRAMAQTETIEIVTLEEQIPPDPASMFFWLKNRQPKYWRDKHEQQITGKDGEPLPPLIVNHYHTGYEIPETTGEDEKDDE